MSAEPKLSLPRLMLRVGGLGNQCFGRDNGPQHGKTYAIDESPDQLGKAIEHCCEEVLDVIEGALKGVLEADRLNEARDGENTFAALAGGFWTRLGQWIDRPLFGMTDRWGQFELAGRPATVFSSERPMIQVLTGDAESVDAMLAGLCKRRADGRAAGYEHLQVVCGPFFGGPWCEGKRLAVGEAPERREPNAELLPREEAAGLAAVRRRRLQAFRNQSGALRHHSDVLLAVWDDDAHSQEAGTRETVQLALQEGLPVIAVRIGHDGQPRIDFLEKPADLLNPSLPGDWHEELREAVRRCTRFPIPGSKPKKHHTFYDPRHVFHRFIQGYPARPVWTVDWAWKLLAAWADGKSSPQPAAAPSARHEDSRGYLESYGGVMTLADGGGLSGLLGDAHRGAIILSYCLAFLAVLIAAVALIFLECFHTAKIVCTMAEAVLIILMWRLHKRAALDDWHEAYTDARLLAEALRMMKHLGPLGVHTPMPRLPHYLAKHPDLPLPELPWTVWYFRCLTRMAPLRLESSVFDAEAGEKPLPGRLKSAVVNEWLEGQIQHHQRNSARHEQIHHFAEKASKVLFGLVGTAAVLHLGMSVAHANSSIHHLLSDFMRSWCLGPHVLFVALEHACELFCICGPLLIAALHGAVSQLESNRIHLRSESMHCLLREQKERIQAVHLEDEHGDSHAVWRLAEESLHAAALMIDETAGWSLLYKNADIQAG